MSVTAPLGFVAASAAGGIKGDDQLDLVLVATEDGGTVPAAAVFTANRATAAPVVVSRAHLETSGGRAAGVLLSSGNANAATGSEGIEAARNLCRLTADGLGVAVHEVLICQTGLIGVPFPLDQVAPSIAGLVAKASSEVEAARLAAEAIMTTDTKRKETTIEADGFVVGAMAKGAAMLAPNMATMLAVLTTDVTVDPRDLRGALRHAVDETFNSLTIDGCVSTNDTVAVLASGRRGPAPLAAVQEALRQACASLAEQMASDAEGATKVARISVSGATSHDEARRSARQVADSLLVKCSLNGADPYWGRIVSELGAAGVGFELDRVSVRYGGVEVCRGGVAVAHDEALVARHLQGDRIQVACDLGLGQGEAVILTTDLGYGYIDENRTTS